MTLKKVCDTLYAYKMDKNNEYYNRTGKFPPIKESLSKHIYIIMAFLLSL